ncbi:uncharacterized protein LOC134956838 isoform X2 [Pseudophryne corroboree]|uniref:uncharacterized protein LOC134956838 isoform X2 n=1 Tax=Pseudophryne corroboree TaxID=495146 RepID=UPI0030814B2C
MMRVKTMFETILFFTAFLPGIYCKSDVYDDYDGDAVPLPHKEGQDSNPETIKLTSISETIAEASSPLTEEENTAPETMEEGSAPSTTEETNTPETIVDVSTPLMLVETSIPKTMKESSTPKTVAAASTLKTKEDTNNPEIMGKANATEITGESSTHSTIKVTNTFKTFGNNNISIAEAKVIEEAKSLITTEKYLGAWVVVLCVLILTKVIFICGGMMVYLYYKKTHRKQGYIVDI